jgi:hypothetical protein
VQEDSVTKLASFLDEDQDVIVSVEKIRCAAQHATAHTITPLAMA